MRELQNKIYYKVSGVLDFSTNLIATNEKGSKIPKMK